MKAMVEGVGIEYETLGTGAPVAVLGGPWLGHSYLRAMGPLAGANRLIYHDAQGTGRTPLGGRGPLTLDALVSDVEGLRASLRIDRWSFVAHSFGAHVACSTRGRTPTASRRSFWRTPARRSPGS